MKKYAFEKNAFEVAATVISDRIHFIAQDPRSQEIEQIVEKIRRGQAFPKIIVQKG